MKMTDDAEGINFCEFSFFYLFNLIHKYVDFSFLF